MWILYSPIIAEVVVLDTLFEFAEQYSQQYSVIIAIADYFIAFIVNIIALSGFYICINDRCDNCYKVR